MPMFRNGGRHRSSLIGHLHRRNLLSGLARFYQSHILYIYLIFPQCLISNVYSNNFNLNRQSHIDCIFVCTDRAKVIFVAFIWLFRQTIWGEIWKHTVEKSTKNAINATLPFLIQVIWVNIWNHTMEKSQINATNVTLPLFGQTIWGDIWKHTVEKSEKMQPMQLCLFWSKLFE